MTITGTETVTVSARTAKFAAAALAAGITHHLHSEDLIASSQDALAEILDQLDLDEQTKANIIGEAQ